MVQAHRVSNISIVVAALSTVVEWYDFTLYLYFATVLARVFFGGGEAALLTTLAGFAVAYLMRPVGAVVFGGDRLNSHLHDELYDFQDKACDYFAHKFLENRDRHSREGGNPVCVPPTALGARLRGHDTRLNRYLSESERRRRL